MNLERARRQAELQDANTRLSRLLIQTDAIATDLRLTIDPLVYDYLEMDLDKAADLMNALQGRRREALKIRERIRALKAALGSDQGY